MTKGRFTALCGFLIVLLCVSLVLAAGIGTVFLRPLDVLRSAVHGPGGAGLTDVIVWKLRLPRIGLAALVGASLGIAGAAFQVLLRNDLADPYLVGVSAGASVGAELVLLRGQEAAWRGLAVPLAAFGSAVAAISVVYGFARRGGRVLVTSLLLGGVVVSAFLGSVSVVLLTFARPDDMQRIQFRLSGSLQDATWEQCAVVLGFLLIGTGLLMGQSRSLNLLALGEESAQQLGTDTERLKTLLIVTGSGLTAATVSVAGIIGFVGLMVPHMSRRIARTPDHRRVLPLSVILGAILMIWADTAARSVLPGGRELPVGVVTALLGAPFFIYLLRRKTRG